MKRLPLLVIVTILGMSSISCDKDDDGYYEPDYPISKFNEKELSVNRIR